MVIRYIKETSQLAFPLQGNKQITGIKLRQTVTKSKYFFHGSVLEWGNPKKKKKNMPKKNPFLFFPQKKKPSVFKKKPKKKKN